jgi:ketosteroid isomerase-like protein
MRALLALLLPVVLAGCAEKLPEAHVLPLVEAERAFNHDAADRGVQVAFLEHLADEAVVFRPGPVPGPAYYRDHPDAGALSWDPSYAEVAESRDLGYTLGPYERRTPAGEVKYGHYVSVWRKQKDGRWRVVVDGGNHHPPPLQVAERFDYRPAPANRGTPTTIDTASEWVRLQAAEKALIAALAVKNRGSQALLQFAAPDIRYFPPGAFPVSGRGAVETALIGQKDELSFEPSGGGIAGTGDLAYTYGKASRRASEQAPAHAGGYLRIWRRSSEGLWQVALELTNTEDDPPPTPDIAAAADEPRKSASGSPASDPRKSASDPPTGSPTGEPRKSVSGPPIK